MLQYRLQPVGNFRCDYATGTDFCDAFVTSTDSSYLLAFLLTANHEAAESCFVAALDQAFKANAVFKEWPLRGFWSKSRESLIGYSENGAFATRSAKFGGANPST